MGDDSILFKGIAIMALISILAGLFVLAAMSKAPPGAHYTAMYMSTGAIDRNITKNHTTVTIPFYVENHEGSRVNYSYRVSTLFKDTVFHSGTDAWSEDLNADEKHDVVTGAMIVDDNKAQMVTLTVPVQSSQKWRYANVTIDLYREGTPGSYRSLRLWAVNQVK